MSRKPPDETTRIPNELLETKHLDKSGEPGKPIYGLRVKENVFLQLQILPSGSSMKFNKHDIFSKTKGAPKPKKGDIIFVAPPVGSKNFKTLRLVVHKVEGDRIWIGPS